MARIEMLEEWGEAQARREVLALLTSSAEVTSLEEGLIKVTQMLPQKWHREKGIPIICLHRCSPRADSGTTEM